MTKKHFKGAFAATFISGMLIAMASCSDYEEQANDAAPPTETEAHRISAEQAIQNALDFVGQYGTTTRTDVGGLIVSDVKAISVNKGDTRSISNDEINLDSLFYVVNFDNDRGFVLAASDDRETPVYAYVEDGKFEDDDTPNNGYDAFVNSLIEAETIRRIDDRKRLTIEDDPYNGGGSNSSNSSNMKPDKFEVMLPLLNTEWGQEDYKPWCPGPYTGCVPTAIAQICSYLRYPENISWTTDKGFTWTYSLDWDGIIQACWSGSGNIYDPDLKKQVAHLMCYWGAMFNAKYESDGTSVDGEYAINKMRELGYNATERVDYNATNVMNDLKKGNRIVFMEGSGRYYHIWFFKRKYVDGHAWVVDGYIHSINNNQEALYLHCNWGWKGRRNGYFLSNALNAEELPYYDNNANPMTRSENFRYKLKTSTICK